MKHAKRFLAAIVVLTAIAFLAVALHRSWAGFTELLVEPGTLIAVGLLAVLYGVSFQLLFVSWFVTLRDRSTVRVPLYRAAHIYNLANIGKYLPGNVFHFAGRQIFGARAGWTHASLAQATLLEISAIVASILALLLATIIISPETVLGTPLAHAYAWSSAELRALALLVVLVALLLFIMFSRNGVFVRLFDVTTPTVLAAIILCAAFFLANAAMVVLLGERLDLESGRPAAATVGTAYIAAWLVGFVVPGAPSGIGVRESVFVLILTAIDEDHMAFALALGIGMRLVSILGDLFAVATTFSIDQSMSFFGRSATHRAEGRANG